MVCCLVRCVSKWNICKGKVWKHWQYLAICRRSQSIAIRLPPSRSFSLSLLISLAHMTVKVTEVWAGGSLFDETDQANCSPSWGARARVCRPRVSQVRGTTGWVAKEQVHGRLKRSTDLTRVSGGGGVCVPAWSECLPACQPCYFNNPHLPTSIQPKTSGKSKLTAFLRRIVLATESCWKKSI